MTIFSFGWGRKGFIVERVGLIKSRVVHQSPLTKEGWDQTWRTLTSDYPHLASLVANRVRSEAGLFQNKEIENGMRSELEALGSLASLSNCVLLGGYGYAEEFTAGTTCNLYFTPEGLWVNRLGSWTPEIRSAYLEAKAIEFSGPGRVTKGGGFFGGGFGLVGAAEGMIVASVLNALTN